MMVLGQFATNEDHRNWDDRLLFSNILAKETDAKHGKRDKNNDRTTRCRHQAKAGVSPEVLRIKTVK